MVGHLQVRTQSLVNTVYLISRFLYCILQQLHVLHLRKKNKIISETGLKIDTKGHTIVSKLFLNCN